MSEDTESMEEVIGWAVHDLTTNITHKAQTPGELDEDCAVLGRAIADRVRAGRRRFEDSFTDVQTVGRET